MSIASKMKKQRDEAICAYVPSLIQSYILPQPGHAIISNIYYASFTDQWPILLLFSLIALAWSLRLA